MGERMDARAERILELGERIDARAERILDSGERLDARGDAIIAQGATIVELGERMEKLVSDATKEAVLVHTRAAGGRRDRAGDDRRAARRSSGPSRSPRRSRAWSSAWDAWPTVCLEGPPSAATDAGGTCAWT